MQQQRMGVVVIGQSPRPSVVNEIAAVLSPGLEIELRGARAEASLLRAWLSARLGRPAAEIALEDADELAVRLDDEDLPIPRPVYATASDLLSAELDCFGRDWVYEEAVTTAASS